MGPSFLSLQHACLEGELNKIHLVMSEITVSYFVIIYSPPVMSFKVLHEP